MGSAQQILQRAKQFQARFNREVVEACGLCPWAEPARKAGRVKILASDKGEEATIRSDTRNRLLDIAPDIEIAQIVFPYSEHPWREWEQVLSSMVEHEVFDVSRWAGAAFHPGFPVDTQSPGARVRLLRKSPDRGFQFIDRRALPKSRDTKWVTQQSVDELLSGEHSVTRKEARETVRENNDRRLLGAEGTTIMERIESLIAER